MARSEKLRCNSWPRQVSQTESFVSLNFKIRIEAQARGSSVASQVKEDSSGRYVEVGIIRKGRGTPSGRLHVIASCTALPGGRICINTMSFPRLGQKFQLGYFAREWRELIDFPRVTSRTPDCRREREILLNSWCKVPCIRAHVC